MRTYLTRVREHKHGPLYTHKSHRVSLALARSLLRRAASERGEEVKFIAFALRRRRRRARVRPTPLPRVFHVCVCVYTYTQSFYTAPMHSLDSRRIRVCVQHITCVCRFLDGRSGAAENRRNWDGFYFFFLGNGREFVFFFFLCFGRKDYFGIWTLKLLYVSVWIYVIQ